MTLLLVIFSLFYRYDLLSINLSFEIYLIIAIIAIIHLMQIVIVSLIKLVYGLNKLIRHRKDFEIRNSPLNVLATLITNISYFFKTNFQIIVTCIGLLITFTILYVILTNLIQKKYNILINKTNIKNI